MPVTPADIQPVADAAAPAPSAPPVEPAAPAPETEDMPAEAKLPEEVLKIPAMHALLQGSPPATYGPLKSKMPEVKTLSKNAEALKQAGFAAFESESMPGNFVLFNGLIVKPDEVMQADKNGQLDSVAAPLEQLVKQFASAKKDAPPEEGAPAAPAPAGQAVAAPAPVGSPAPAGAQKRLLGARVANLVPGSPTSGAMPGRGRVLNAISKSAV